MFYRYKIDYEVIIIKFIEQNKQIIESFIGFFTILKCR
jgi:hypothetical protein